MGNQIWHCLVPKGFQFVERLLLCLRRFRRLIDKPGYTAFKRFFGTLTSTARQKAENHQGNRTVFEAVHLPPHAQLQPNASRASWRPAGVTASMSCATTAPFQLGSGDGMYRRRFALSVIQPHEITSLIYSHQGPALARGSRSPAPIVAVDVVGRLATRHPDKFPLTLVLINELYQTSVDVAQSRNQSILNFKDEAVNFKHTWVTGLWDYRISILHRTSPPPFASSRRPSCF